MLKDFKKEKEMPREVIEKYKNLVPDEVIEIWENYGLGSFFKGYLKIINPNDYKELIEKTFFEGKESIPIFATVFGDIILWNEEEEVIMVKYKDFEYRILLKKRKNFHFFFSSENIKENEFELGMYRKILKNYGEVHYEDCYCFELKSFIQKKKIENVTKEKIISYIEKITNILGKIEILKDFKKEKEMPKEVIEKYRNLVPKEIVEIWENHGLGSFLNGYLRVINPDEYKELLNQTFFLGEVSIPLFTTAFADVITWQENEFIGIVKYKENDNDYIGKTIKFFIKFIYDGEEDNFDLKLYEKAIKKYGELEYNQSFCFVPLLGLGGKKNVNNLDKCDTLVHIYLITELVGKVGIDD